MSLHYGEALRSRDVIGSFPLWPNQKLFAITERLSCAVHHQQEAGNKETKENLGFCNTRVCINFRLSKAFHLLAFTSERSTHPNVFAMSVARSVILYITYTAERVWHVDRPSHRVSFARLASLYFPARRTGNE